MITFVINCKNSTNYIAFLFTKSQYASTSVDA